MVEKFLTRVSSSFIMSWITYLWPLPRNNRAIPMLMLIKLFFLSSWIFFSIWHYILRKETWTDTLQCTKLKNYKETGNRFSAISDNRNINVVTSKQSPEEEDSQFSMKLNKYARSKVYKKVQISPEDWSSKRRQSDRARPINLLTLMEGRNWLPTEGVKST